jgi:hypothetical protein
MKIFSRMLLLLAFVGLPLFSTGSSTALAQNASEPAGLKNVHLWIYPEYDDPRLLIMMEGQIDGAEAPATVKFLVPAAAEMYSAGSIDATGKYSGGPPARQSSALPGYDEISFEVKTNTFRMEYYDPGITGQPDKSIVCEFHSLYPISVLNVILQQPRTATNFVVSPAGESYIDAEGFNLHVYSYPSVTVNESIGFRISYTKTDTRPSVQIQNPGNSTLKVVIPIIAVLVVAGGGLFLWMRKSRGRLKTVQHRDKRRKGRFCGQCGKPVDSTHKFCPNCGARIT